MAQLRRRSLALILIMTVVLAGNLAAAHTVRESLAKMTHGKRIKIVLKNGENLVGRLGTIQADSFELDPDNKKGTGRTLQTNDVQAISTKMTKAEKWGIAAAIYGGLCIIGLVLGG